MNENQMKICFISQAQYNSIWDKSMPQDRFASELTTNSLMSRKLNTLFIVGKAEDFLAKPEEVIPENWREHAYDLRPKQEIA
jgi:hypothetical protein